MRIIKRLLCNIIDQVKDSSVKRRSEYYNLNKSTVFPAVHSEIEEFTNI